jgi:hypothetical protein
MKFTIISLAACALIIVSCSLVENDAVEPETLPEIKIIGMWNWVESIHGWTGRKIVPESEGYTQQLHFYKDGSFSHIRADTLVKSGTYVLIMKDDHLVLSYEFEGQGFYPDQQVTFKTYDRIELIYLCIDCPSSMYERIK